MFPIRHITAVVATLVLFGGVCAAQSGPVADPGFVFVDVNGDGLYSPTVDIGLASNPSVDVNALILSDGVFDTQKAKTAGGSTYKPPKKPAGLVIPASQSLVLTLPLHLRAGGDLIVHGSLQAPVIVLEAGSTRKHSDDDRFHGSHGESVARASQRSGTSVLCDGGSARGTIDLTGSTCWFDVSMTALARKDIVLNGMSATGTDLFWIGTLPPVTTFTAAAGRSIIGEIWGPAAVGPAVAVGEGIVLQAGKALSASSASFYVYDTAGSIKGASHDHMALKDQTSFISGGSILLKAEDEDLEASNASFQASDVSITAEDEMALSGCSVQATGTVSLASDEELDLSRNAPSSIQAGSIAIEGEEVHARGASLFATSGPIAIGADDDGADISGASIFAPFGLSILAEEGVDFSSALIQAGTYVKVASAEEDECGEDDEGGVVADNSQIWPVAGADPSTFISVTASGPVHADHCNWNAPASIGIQSLQSNVTARYSAFNAATIGLFAGGLAIDVTGTSFGGSVSYGPAGVVVTGP
ncbi:MAG: hypothetical protein ACP5VE_10960 [Chthonomonadales bacterium]